MELGGIHDRNVSVFERSLLRFEGLDQLCGHCDPSGSSADNNDTVVNALRREGRRVTAEGHRRRRGAEEEVRENHLRRVEARAVPEVVVGGRREE